jgi:hypothetical protein
MVLQRTTSAIIAGIIFVVLLVSFLVVYRSRGAASDAPHLSSSIYTPENLGINLPWLDLHNGTEADNWLNTQYNGTLINNDLKEIEQMGITKIRSFCQLESIFDFVNEKFVLNEQYAKNLDDFLYKAASHGISVICVMGAGNYGGNPQNLDGHFRWDLVTTPEGIRTYAAAYAAYVERFKRHKNIIMWEIHNEPYGELSWSGAAAAAHVTEEEMRQYLAASYVAIKPIASDTFVGFSDLEEEEQAKYQLFSDPERRVRLVDNYTDAYSMHIYRKDASQVHDFSDLAGKPKWVVELGSYNYLDPRGVGHPLPANNELYDTQSNYDSTVSIADKLIHTGFTLIMPWAFTSNTGMVTHNPDGTHTLYALPLWMKEQLGK